MSASTEKKLRREAREAGIDKKEIAAKKEAEKRAKEKRRWSLVGAGVALLVIIAIILGSGVLYNMTAYTVGDRNFSASEVNYHYASQYNSFANQYGSYAAIFGLDTSNGVKGLDEQECYMTEEGGTWKDYFLDMAKNAMIQTVALSQYAEENGITVPEEEVALIDSYFTDMDSVAKMYGYANGDAFFAANYGEGVDEAMVYQGYLDSALASQVIEHVTNSYTYTAQELEEKYQSYEGAQDVYSYAYYTVAAEAAEDGTVSEEALKEAKAAAEKILEAYEASEGEDYLARFNEALAAYSADASVSRQQTTFAGVPCCGDWMSDDERAAGDITMDLNVTEDGYNVALFLDYSDNHYNMANVRHILVKAVADENGEYTAAAKAEAKAKAEEILAEYEAGEKTEERFAELANLYSEDEGSNTVGGLYENIAKGQMVEEFDQFCFEGHKKGDTAVVYGESSAYAGYHVMYYVEDGMMYSDYLADSELRNTATAAWLEELMAQYETKDGAGMKLVG